MPPYFGDALLSSGLTSASQRARVITEAWVAENGYCIACTSDRLLPTRANTKSRDFECERCSHPYELKSSSGVFGKRITDGAYSSMISRIRNGTVANLLLLQYGPEWQITNLWAVHRLLITEPIIQERKPLAFTARRAGWIGCNILLDSIPPEGRIPIIAGGESLSRAGVRKLYAATDRLQMLSPSRRGWTSTVLSALHRLGKSRFTTEDAYSIESEVSAVYPNNENVRPKIRQQLQVLRDAGLLRFESRGVYSFAIDARRERGSA
jgi:type II restriction enzyme